MIEVLFFGRVREELACEKLSVESAPDLDALQGLLVEQGGERWSQVLGQDNIIRAVNQAVVADNVALREGDEVAFFPPVTGG